MMFLGGGGEESFWVGVFGGWGVGGGWAGVVWMGCENGVKRGRSGRSGGGRGWRGGVEWGGVGWKMRGGGVGGKMGGKMGGEGG
jgi:hypothetical protein